MEQIMYIVMVTDLEGTRSTGSPLAVAPTRELAEHEANRLSSDDGGWAQAWVEEVDLVSEKVDFFS